MRYSFAWLLAALLLCAFARADQVILKDGKVLNGTVTSEDDRQIVMSENPDAQFVVTKRISRDLVDRIERDPVPEGTTYFEVPIIGEFGREITKEALAEALQVAEEQNATYIVFLVDSPGGSVDEVTAMVGMMGKARKAKTIAMVKNAYSAAAVFSATCDYIVVYPGSHIGAALPYLARNGVPVEVNEKLTSAFRATVRMAAATGGHDPAFFEAMVDPATELYLVEGPPQTASLIRTDPGSRCIKPSGKILTLTDAEAVKYGIAKGICKTLTDVRQVVGVESWQPRSRRGYAIMQKHGATYRATAAEQQRQTQFASSLEEYQRWAIPELKRLGERIAAADAIIAATSEALTAAEADHRASLKRIEADHQRAKTDAQTSANSRYYLVRAEETKRLATEIAEQSYKERVGELRRKLEAAEGQRRSDIARRKQIVAEEPTQ